MIISTHIPTNSSQIDLHVLCAPNPCRLLLLFYFLFLAHSLNVLRTSLVCTGMGPSTRAWTTFE